MLYQPTVISHCQSERSEESNKLTAESTNTFFVTLRMTVTFTFKKMIEKINPNKVSD